MRMRSRRRWPTLIHRSAAIRMSGISSTRSRPISTGTRFAGSALWCGSAKDDLIRRARAVLFPLQWEEPGGTAMVEALSLGTPVVGLARGVFPTLVEHGVTGWIADSELELAGFLDRVDELDPAACQRVARQRFSPAEMATSYESLYLDALARTSPQHAYTRERAEDRIARHQWHRAPYALSGQDPVEGLSARS